MSKTSTICPRCQQDCRENKCYIQCRYGKYCRYGPKRCHRLHDPRRQIESFRLSHRPDQEYIFLNRDHVELHFGERAFVIQVSLYGHTFSKSQAQQCLNDRIIGADLRDFEDVSVDIQLGVYVWKIPYSRVTDVRLTTP